MLTGEAALLDTHTLVTGITTAKLPQLGGLTTFLLELFPTSLWLQPHFLPSHLLLLLVEYTGLAVWLGTLFPCSRSLHHFLVANSDLGCSLGRVFLHLNVLIGGSCVLSLVTRNKEAAIPDLVAVCPPFRWVTSPREHTIRKQILIDRYTGQSRWSMAILSLWQPDRKLNQSSVSP